MSNPNDTESARERARNDANRNHGPADTTSWDWQSRNAYDAELQRQRDQNNKQNG